MCSITVDQHSRSTRWRALINEHARTLDTKIADESGETPFRMRSDTVILAISTLRPAETPANSGFVSRRAQFGTKAAEYVLIFNEVQDSWAGKHRCGRPFTERLLFLLSYTQTSADPDRNLITV